MLYVPLRTALQTSLFDFSFENSLAAVNVLLCGVGVTQVTRILMYQSSVQNSTLSEVAEAEAKDAKVTVTNVVEDVERVAKEAKV